MTNLYLAVATAYAVFTACLVSVEFRRTRQSGADPITVFIALFLLQCCLPGVLIFGALPFVDPSLPTGNFAFDKIYQAITLETSLLVFGLTVSFVFFFYVGAAIGRVVLADLSPTPEPARRQWLVAVEWRLWLILTLALCATIYSFYLMGDSTLERYSNLLGLRAHSEDVERNEFNTYAFSLTQTWGWLSIPAVMVAVQTKRRMIASVFVVCAILFALLGGSRRAIFVPVILSYFALLLHDGRWRIRALVVAAAPIILWVAYGKEILAVLAFGGTSDDVVGRYQTIASGVLRAGSDVGITVAESLGTINLMDLDLRYGIDHLLSIVRRIPARWFGMSIDLPPRVVRLATSVFAGVDEEDVPPGLLGQMWLDFGVFGPVVWGLFLGLQMSVVRRIYAGLRRSLEACAVMALVAFIVALPLNTGSYDFSFSVDVIALFLVLMVTFKKRENQRQLHLLHQ